MVSRSHFPDDVFRKRRDEVSLQKGIRLFLEEVHIVHLHLILIVPVEAADDTRPGLVAYTAANHDVSRLVEVFWLWEGLYLDHGHGGNINSSPLKDCNDSHIYNNRENR